MPHRVERTLDDHAERYVRLVLGLGIHDPDEVDAYYGPQDVREEVNRESPPLASLRAEAIGLLAELAALPVPRDDELLALRHAYLRRQTEALLARVEMLSGRRFTFDEESQALYDASAPRHSEAHFRGLLGTLDGLLPGSGPVAPRFEAFRQRFVIPRASLDAVFGAAIAEGRRRTREHIRLPPNESFVVEYVTGKAWSGYNWYRGDAHSLIQVNTDLPITIDRAVDLACHEGYPGHHVYNAMLEEHLVRGRGWTEYTVYALFSPQSLIAEGTANYGIAMAFPGGERVAFEREALFPLAGLDAAEAERYYAAHAAFLALGYAGNEAARRYLNGDFTREEAAAWLVDYALMSPARAEQRTRFFDQYRSYVINYNLGQDLVREHLASLGATPEHPARHWEEFARLISSPRLPSGLRRGAGGTAAGAGDGATG